MPAPAMTEPTDNEQQPPTRFVNPLGMRVLVRMLPGDERTKAGLYLPQSVQDDGADAVFAEVVGVALAVPEHGDVLEGSNVSGIPDGSKVLFAPEAGYRVPWDQSLRLVESKDVLALVEEYDTSKAN